MTAEEIKTLLQLRPHEPEGGYYRRTYSNAGVVETPHGSRLAASAIYYLLEPGSFSEMHRLRSDEIFHFYLGDPVEMLHLYPDGRSALFTLGSDLAHDQQVQLVVPAGTWQGCRLLEGGSVALLGCTVTPGFDFDDYESGVFADLAAQWPWQKERIRLLTKR
jgi:hypothetical protein